jgi:hypothetical protein
MADKEFEGAAEDLISDGVLYLRQTYDMPNVLAVVDRAERIQPGDWVEHRERDLDPREVIAVGLDWIVLDFGSIDRDDPSGWTRLPMDNYQVLRYRRGAL